MKFGLWHIAANTRMKTKLLIFQQFCPADQYYYLASWQIVTNTMMNEVNNEEGESDNEGPTF